MKIICRNSSLIFQQATIVPVEPVTLGTYTSVGTTAVNAFAHALDGRKGLVRLLSSDANSTTQQTIDNYNIAAKNLWSPIDKTLATNTKIYIRPSAVDEVFTLEFIESSDYLLPTWYVKQNVQAPVNINTNNGAYYFAGDKAMTNFIAGDKTVTLADAFKNTEIRVYKYSADSGYNGSEAVTVPDTGIVDLSLFSSALIRLQFANVPSPIVSIQ